MSKNSAFIFIFCVLAARGAMAQQMYKIIGPDGRVTFSDRPALQTQGKISVMQSNTLRPYAAKLTPAEVAAAEAAQKLAATKAVEASAPTVPQELTQEVQNGIVSVMGQVEFSRRFYNFCNGTEASARAFNAAVLGWKRRNASAIEHQKRLLMEVVSPNKRDEMQDKVATLLSAEAAKVAALNPIERQSWCGGAVAQLSTGQADIVQPAMMAVPIVRYRAK
jgi:hypothetical protein